MLLYRLGVLLSALFLFSSFSSAARVTNPSKPPKNAVLLSKIQTLTLRAAKQTSHRRVSSVPQLRCAGPSHICSLYDVDVMRCTNQGADYDENTVQWTCTASLPEEFKLGSTDVTCEGYESSDDPFVLKGSCGVEYRLLLTDKGEEKYGKESSWNFPGKSKGDKVIAFMFWVLFVGVIVLMALSAMGCFRGTGAGGLGGRQGWGGGGGGGGGGWGWGGGDDDSRGPPPPYAPRPPRPARKTQSSYSSPRAARTEEAWRPGFWSGALGGAAAGYLAGRGGNQNRQQAQAPPVPRSFFSRESNGGEGSSRSAAPSFSSSRHESSGFGSTSRR